MKRKTKIILAAYVAAGPLTTGSLPDAESTQKQYLEDVKFHFSYAS